MKIRKEQMVIFGQIELSKYELRIAEFLQKEFVDAGKMRSGELTSAIHDQVIRSQVYGFETEQQIACYVTTAWMLGPNFDTEFPGAQDILTSGKKADDKTRLLSQWTEELFSILDGKS